MKKSEKQDLHSAKPAELIKKAEETRAAINQEAQKRQVSEVKNVRMVKILRDKLARILTVLRSHELVQEGETV